MFSKQGALELCYKLSESLKRSDSGVDSKLESLRYFDLATAKLYELRSQQGAQGAILAKSEDYLSGVAAELLVQQRRDTEKNVYREWLSKYRRIWRREMSLFLFTLTLFVACCLIGWNLARNHIALIPLLLPQSLMESIIEHEAWFEEIRKSPALHGLLIAWNNIRVSITCFLLSVLIGLGGLFILCLNGIFFGAVMGYCYSYGFHERLTAFVLSHGPLELTIIIASAFAGLIYGRVFYLRPYSLFGQRMMLGAKDALTVMCGIIPWLVLAATIEVFVSPFEYLSVEAKMALGWALAILFWVWTYRPTLDKAQT